MEFMGVVERPEEFRQRLLGGERTCPPEDCGGVWGYEECVEVAGMCEGRIVTSEDKGLFERKEWIGDWNPETFDLDEAKKEFDR